MPARAAPSCKKHRAPLRRLKEAQKPRPMRSPTCRTCSGKMQSSLTSSWLHVSCEGVRRESSPAGAPLRPAEPDASVAGILSRQRELPSGKVSLCQMTNARRCPNATTLSYLPISEPAGDSRRAADRDLVYVTAPLEQYERPNSNITGLLAVRAGFHPTVRQAACVHSRALRP